MSDAPNKSDATSERHPKLPRPFEGTYSVNASYDWRWPSSVLVLAFCVTNRRLSSSVSKSVGADLLHLVGRTSGTKGNSRSDKVFTNAHELSRMDASQPVLAESVSRVLGLPIGLRREHYSVLVASLDQKNSRLGTECARSSQCVPEADIPSVCADFAIKTAERGSGKVYTPSSVLMELR